MRRTKFCAFIVLLTIIVTSCEGNIRDEQVLDDDLLQRKLTIELVTYRDKEDTLLHEKIRQFNAKRKDMKVEIKKRFKGHDSGLMPWLLDRKGIGDPPDLIELTPNEMKLAFAHGKVEALNFNEPHLRDLVLSTSDGYVIGMKTKINPLIVYYNKDTFLELGLEAPSEEWDWDMLDNTIATLKGSGKNVYIMLSPHILEWVTINRYGGRITDMSGTVFTGYLNSDEAVRAAEWLKWVGTKEEDYKARKFNDSIMYSPIPLDLVEGNMALAIDYAHIFRQGSILLHNFEGFIQDNDRIGIAPLPGGSEVVNVAHTAGLAIPTYSQNKDLAMELLRYLTEDAETYYEDILWYTLQTDTNVELQDPARASLVIKEMKRSVPSSLLMYEGQNHGKNDLHFRRERRAIMEGEPIETVLERMAQEIDLKFDSFKEALEHYSQCIKQMDHLCHGY